MESDSWEIRVLKTIPYLNGLVLIYIYRLYNSLSLNTG